VREKIEEIKETMSISITAANNENAYRGCYT